MSCYCHKICDPIHGFIRFSDKEKELIETRAFQRLRYLSQMGMAYLVYPGATHSRFEHSLGVMELSSRIYRSLQPNVDEEVVRLVALCHDLGHLPFSHTAEQTLLGEKGHERMTIEIVKTLSIPHKEEVLRALSGEGIAAEIIADDNFGADRIDYLLRDATYTGVKFGHLDYNQLIDSLAMVDDQIGVHVSGIQSVESLSIARYMMYARVYHHPKVHFFTQEMINFMENHYLRMGFPQTVAAYLREKDYTILAAMEALDHPLLKGEVLPKSLLRAPKEGRCQRDFPVILESGEVISSSQASPFLGAIPQGDMSGSLT